MMRNFLCTTNMVLPMCVLRCVQYDKLSSRLSCLIACWHLLFSFSSQTTEDSAVQFTLVPYCSRQLSQAHIYLAPTTYTTGVFVLIMMHARTCTHTLSSALLEILFYDKLIEDI